MSMAQLILTLTPLTPTTVLIPGLICYISGVKEQKQVRHTTATCSWDINIHCVCRLAWQTDKFIFMSVVTEQIKARLKSILPQRLCSFCLSNSVEMARTGESTLRISKCQVWAVLTRAKCHGSLLTRGVESFSTYPQSLISVLMPQRPRSDSGLKRLNEM